MAQSATVQPLNEVQMMLLRLFSRPTGKGDLEKIRELLIGYYESALQEELDRVIEVKGISESDFETILNKQYRTK